MPTVKNEINMSGKFLFCTAFAVAVCGLVVTACSAIAGPKNGARHTHNWGGWTQTAYPRTDERVCKTDPSHKEIRLTGIGRFSFEPIGSADGGTSYRVCKCAETRDEVRIPAFYRPDADRDFLPVTEIGGGAFAHCNNLTGVILPDGVTTIGSNAFNGCTVLVTVTFAQGSRLESIGDRAFDDAGLTGITIPAGVTSIGERAFAFCESLTSITIPASVTSIGEGAFVSCRRLTGITVDPDNPMYASEGGILYNKAKTALLAFPSASGNITIPAGVTSIGDNVFYGFTGLTGVTIPVNVTTIGVQAFILCTSLATVTFAAGSQLQTIGYRAFSNCIRLTSIAIPARVTSVGGAAFFGWTNAQTISVEGYANQTSADAAWGKGWRNQCHAKIRYSGRQ